MSSVYALPTPRKLTVPQSLAHARSTPTGVPACTRATSGKTRSQLAHTRPPVGEGATRAGPGRGRRN